MHPSNLARTLAVVDTAVAGVVTGLAQWTYDLPTRRRRYAAQAALALAGGAVLMASDAVWTAAVRDRTPPPDPDAALSDPERALLRRQLTISLAAVPVWVAGRGLPAAMRRRGIAQPNRLLAVPVALGWTLASAPVEWAYARERTAALLP
ncbi:hypothetical protein [Kineococcus sp. SYSU DK002]|uniref:hypothetical protein n=1 Tax=Kineococcus sp. SYSU DK002 TaxID=3383123 RepID=UPI003D7E9905